MRRYGSFDHGGLRFAVLYQRCRAPMPHPAGTPENVAAVKELARLEAAKVRQAASLERRFRARRNSPGSTGSRCRRRRTAGRKVIVLAHHPVFPDNEHNVWNWRARAATQPTPHVVAWTAMANNTRSVAAKRSGVPYDDAGQGGNRGHRPTPRRACWRQIARSHWPRARASRREMRVLGEANSVLGETPPCVAHAGNKTASCVRVETESRPTTAGQRI